MNLEYKLRSYLGALLFIILFFKKIFDSHTTFNALSVFISLKLLSICILFIIREKPTIVSPIQVNVMCWLSTLSPLLYRLSPNEYFFLNKIDPNSILALLIIGESLSFMGLVTLGKSFGVSPAKRTVVVDGIYRFIKHPIYLGYIISEISIILLYPSLFNFCLFFVSTLLYAFRMHLETRIIFGNSRENIL